MALDLFHPMTLLKAVESERYINTSFLRDRFFGNVVLAENEQVQIDITDANGFKLAAFVNPRIGGGTVNSVGYKTNIYTPPEVSPTIVTTAEDLLVRRAGESLYTPLTGEQRAAKKLADDLRILDAMIGRREEKMCAEALFTGKVTVKGDGYDDEIDFWSGLEDADKPIVTPTNKWSNSSTNIPEELRNMVRTMTQRGGFHPTELLCGSKVIDAILSNESVKQMLDLYRFNNGEINPELRENGVVYYGRLKDVGLDIYEYTGFYDDEGEDGKVTRTTYVPEDKALLAASGVATTMGYSICSVIDPKSDSISWVSAKRVPTSYLQVKNPAGRVLQLKSRPLPIINQIFGFTVVDPL